jgi:hypothetical protein
MKRGFNFKQRRCLLIKRAGMSTPTPSPSLTPTERDSTAVDWTALFSGLLERRQSPLFLALRAYVRIGIVIHRWASCLSILQRVEPLLCNGREISKPTRAVSRQGLGRYVPAATGTHAAIEVLLETVFYTRSVKSGCKEDS